MPKCGGASTSLYASSKRLGPSYATVYRTMYAQVTLSVAAAATRGSARSDRRAQPIAAQSSTAKYSAICGSEKRS